MLIFLKPQQGQLPSRPGQQLPLQAQVGQPQPGQAQQGQAGQAGQAGQQGLGQSNASGRQLSQVIIVLTVNKNYFLPYSLYDSKCLW